MIPDLTSVYEETAWPSAAAYHDFIRSAAEAAYREAAARKAKKKAAKQKKTTSLNLLEWTQKYRPFLEEGRPFDLRNHLYLEGIYRCRAQRQVYKKASQMGLSEFAISYSFEGCDQRDATVLYVFPTDGDVSDFSSARVGTAIDASPYLQSIVSNAEEPDSSGRKRKTTSRVTLKQIRRRFLYLRGGRVSPDGRAAQLKSVAADIVILDELDEMDPRAPGIAEKRLGHSPMNEMLYISTPTYANRGIDAEFQKSDQREWFIRCAGCGEWQPLTIEQVVIEWDDLQRPVAWHGMDEGRAFVACRKCGHELDRTGPGEWVAAFPSRPVAGFQLTKLFSATTNLLTIVAALQETNQTKRKETFNQDLGMAYKPRGGQLTEDVLDACRREYAHGPDKDLRPVMGVDVGELLNVVIRGPLNSNGERPQLFAGEVLTFEEAGRLMKQYKVKRCVVDGLPETRKAREFQNSFPDGRVWLAYYTDDSKEEKAVRYNEDPAKRHVILDRTRSLDTTFSLFVDEVNTLPADAREIRNYYAQMQAPVRVIENSRTGQVARYVESGPDHYAHAENYCWAASQAPRFIPGVPLGVGVSGWSPR